MIVSCFPKITIRRQATTSSLTSSVASPLNATASRLTPQERSVQVTARTPFSSSSGSSGTDHCSYPLAKIGCTLGQADALALLAAMSGRYRVANGLLPAPLDYCDMEGLISLLEGGENDENGSYQKGDWECCNCSGPGLEFETLCTYCKVHNHCEDCKQQTR